MATVYILYSKSIAKFYVGSCKNLKVRILKHQNKEFNKSFTLRAHDWELYFSIDNLGYNQAREIEKHIKKMKSKAYIRNLKKYADMKSKLILKYA